jgi:hypothetical protein
MLCPKVVRHKMSNYLYNVNKKCLLVTELSGAAWPVTLGVALLQLKMVVAFRYTCHDLFKSNWMPSKADFLSASTLAVNNCMSHLGQEGGVFLQFQKKVAELW